MMLIYRYKCYLCYKIKIATVTDIIVTITRANSNNNTKNTQANE